MKKNQNEVKGVKVCRDCLTHIRKLAKCNNRNHHEELNMQIDYVLNGVQRQNIRVLA